MFQKLYYFLPEFLQDIIFSFYGLYLKKLRFNFRYHNHLKSLKKLEWYTDKEIKSYQADKFNLMLRIASESSDFYKYWFEKHNINIKKIKSIDQINELPISSKEDIRASNLDYFNKSIPKSKLKKSLTSGTSGQSFTVFNTLDTLSFQWAIWGRHKSRFGINVPGHNYLMFGARVPIGINSNRFFRKDFGLNRSYLSIFKLNDKMYPKYINYINNNKFDYYTGYPSAMYLLAKYMLDNNIELKLKPKIIITGSDALYPHYKDTIERAWGVSVTEQYGMVEACGNFSKCEFGKFHLDYEMGFVEFVDIPGNEKSKFKKMLFTSLSNYAMPLIRYDVGDLVIPSEEKCECGRHSVVVFELSGREEDYILTKDGAKIQGFNQVFEYAKGIDLIQIYQNRIGVIDVRYVKGKYFSSKDIEVLEFEFRKRMGTNIEIFYKEVKTINKTKSGKYKSVISEIR